MENYRKWRVTSMEPIFDLSDFRVVSSDWGETYGIFSKYFASGEDALRFCSTMQHEIVAHIENGNAKFYSAQSYYPFGFGYLPMVAFKLPSCSEYDRDGNCEYDNHRTIEIMGCILNSQAYPNGLVEITILLIAPPDDLDKPCIKKIDVYGDDFF